MTVVIYKRSNNWASTIQDIIENTEINAFKSISLGRAAIAQAITNGFLADNVVASTYALELFRSDLPSELPLNYTKPYESYFTTEIDTPLVDPPRPPGNQEKLYSGYFSVNITTIAQLNASTENMSRSTILDNVMRALAIGKPSIQAIYAGFTDFGFRRYPYVFDDSRRTGTFCNVSFAPAELQQKVGFIPACRAWYQKALTSASAAGVVDVLGPAQFSPPFISAITKRVATTTSQALFTQAGLKGVIAIELEMDSLNSALTQTSVLRNGYMFMVDLNGTLIV
ncbi:hypothetical protein BC938DRAFT_471467 [Jimgerdemannia flammicorona]|uniref:Uncharacterized protein n=1 Tax=Jimgerdemannia flammicorona TaxID=994334 RepID=A0A433QUK8_9FUNG|nr:hypothetical protein BC938DRAFT_471467 [Jimgerdemannia flammicorona]